MKQSLIRLCFWALFSSWSVPVGQVTGQPDHACRQHSGLSSHHDDTAALGNIIRRQTTAIRQKKTSERRLRGQRGNAQTRCGGEEGQAAYTPTTNQTNT